MIQYSANRPETAILCRLCQDSGRYCWEKHQIPAIFHSFFHRCGKLWGETERAWSPSEPDNRRAVKEGDSNTFGRDWHSSEPPGAIDTLGTASLTLRVRFSTEDPR